VVCIHGCGEVREDAARSTSAPSASTTRPAPPKPSASADTSASPPVSPPQRLKLATFNAGLAPGVLPHVDARADALARRLPAVDVDALCVQEVWTEKDWQLLRAALAPGLPRTLRAPPMAANESTGCSPQNVERAKSCASSRCAGLRGDRQVACVVRRCGHLASTLDAGCLSCLTADPRRAVDDTLRACTSPSPPRASGPFEGSAGVALLTRLDVLADDVLHLESAGERHAALYARVAALGEDLHVFCTHLTAPIAGLSRPSPAHAAKEQAAQVDALLAWIEEKTQGKLAVLLGDLNTGPSAPPHVRAQTPNHYARIAAKGFENPFLATLRCTLCFDNPIVGGSGAGGLAIDHVLVRGWVGSSTSARFLDEPVELTAEKRVVRSRYSDHYGVLTVLERSGAADPAPGSP
jgi:endonuclease/exonuclease/phosphatase family metal-dependent hydrolase